MEQAIVYGWGGVAAALGVSYHTARRWWERYEDSHCPLPILSGPKGIYAYEPALRAFLDAHEQDISRGVHKTDNS